MDTEEIEFSKRIGKEKSVLNIMTLVPHKRYLVSIMVQSDDMTSEVVEESTITMIDRKSFGLNASFQAQSNGEEIGVG